MSFPAIIDVIDAIPTAWPSPAGDRPTLRFAAESPCRGARWLVVGLADLPLHGPCRHGHRHAEGRPRLWNGRLQPGDPARLVRKLYEEENRGLAEPSGSTDMIGLI